MRTGSRLILASSRRRSESRWRDGGAMLGEWTRCNMKNVQMNALVGRSVGTRLSSSSTKATTETLFSARLKRPNAMAAVGQVVGSSVDAARRSAGMGMMVHSVRTVVDVGKLVDVDVPTGNSWVAARVSDERSGKSFAHRRVVCVDDDGKELAWVSVSLQKLEGHARPAHHPPTHSGPFPEWSERFHNLQFAPVDLETSEDVVVERAIEKPNVARFRRQRAAVIEPGDEPPRSAEATLASVLDSLFHLSPIERDARAGVVKHSLFIHADPVLTKSWLYAAEFADQTPASGTDWMRTLRVFDESGVCVATVVREFSSSVKTTALPDFLQWITPTPLKETRPYRAVATSKELGWGRMYGGQLLAQTLAFSRQTLASSPTTAKLRSTHAYFLENGDTKMDVDLYLESGSPTKLSSGEDLVSAVASQGDRPLLRMDSTFGPIPPSMRTRRSPLSGQTPPPKVDMNASPDSFAKLMPARFRSSLFADRGFDYRPESWSERGLRLWFKREQRDIPLEEDHAALVCFACDCFFPPSAMARHPNLDMWRGDVHGASLCFSAHFFDPQLDVNEWVLAIVQSPVMSNDRALSHADFYQEGRLMATATQEVLIRGGGARKGNAEKSRMKV